MDRNYGIDKIRVLLTLLVILHHVAIVYGGAGGWFWVENPAGSNLALTLFVAINQSFFMGFFFLLAGYYSAFSLERKDAYTFLKDRAVRLGAPLFAFAFFIHPFCVALYHPEISPYIFIRTLILIQNGSFGSGPLWFLGALLIFSLALALLKKLNRGSIPSLKTPPSFFLIFTTIILAGILNFIIRIEFPINRSILGMTLGHFPAYIILFFAGSACASKQLIEHLALRKIAPFIIVSFIAIVTLPTTLHLFKSGDASGGLGPKALYYAFWEPIAGFGIILGLLWLFTTHMGSASRVWGFLAEHAYGIYIVHTPLVIFVTYNMHNLIAPPPAKFFIASIASVLLSICAAALLLRLPYAKKVL